MIWLKLCNIEIKHFLWNNNNTFKQAPASRGCLVLGGQGTQRNINIRNNIITSYSVAPMIIERTNSGTLTIDTLLITHNDFYNNANSNNIQYTSITPTHLTVSNQITSNPLFVSSTDFNLQLSSPCIDAGTNIGYSYSGSSPDMG